MFLISLLIFEALAELSCLSPSGKPVDWFVALKYPKVIDPDGKIINYMKNNILFKQILEII